MKTIILIAALLFTTFQTAFASEPYKRNNSDDTRLTSLMTEIHPSIYLTNGETNVYGKEPIVLHADANDLKRWSTINSELAANVELIKIRVTNADTEKATVSAAQLTSFTNLKYIVVLYEYNSGTESATSQKADTMVKLPENSEAKLFWLISIPE